MKLALTEQTFVFKNGEKLLFDNSMGRILNVKIIKRIYTHEYPAYLVYRTDDVFGRGYDVSQSFLRRDVSSYAKQHSPQYVHR